MGDSHIAEIRAFNRFYTRQIGLLNEHVARSRFSLSEGRVLYEIEQAGQTSATALAQSLAMDPAYLSRILQKLVTLKLIALTPDPDDRRRNHIALTRKGEKASIELHTLNDTAVGNLIAPLDEAKRNEIVAAMRAIRSAFGDTPVNAPIVLRAHRSGDLGWLIHRQGLLYNQQVGWDVRFEALISGIYREFEEAQASPPKHLWVAEQAGRIVGSVFVIPFEGSAEIAQLRMLYVEPDMRGQGLGTTLVQQVIAFARDHRYRRIRLWTQENLASARRIYQALGFKLVGSEPHHSFSQDLISEFWELDL